jgi:predicted membrane-bound spermidine synthase
MAWKILLGAMVFLCGWVLMALEMVGPYLLQSVFGSGIYVWGSIISTFLLALSLGYWLGGRVSRQWNHPAVLTIVGLAVACWTVLILVLHRPVNDWLFDQGVGAWKLKEQWPALAAAIVWFFVPSAMLGMVSPVAIRLAASDLETVGQSAGTLYAISTVGSFLGCLVTTFHLVERYGVSAILRGHAIALAIGSVLFLLASLRFRKAP